MKDNEKNRKLSESEQRRLRDYQVLCEQMKEKGYRINNIDVMVTLEKPKLKDYIVEMRNNIANILETSIDNVSVKAGTNEGLGALGRGEAVKAEVIVLLKEEE